MRKRRNPVNRRIRLLLAVLLVVFAALLGRATWLQAVQAGSLSQLASNQHRAVVVLPASRGTIFDRTGVQLAIGEQATTVYADPRQVRDARLSRPPPEGTLDVDADALYSQLVDKKRSFVYVKRKADPAKAAMLEKRGLAGLGFYPEERRFYPQGSVASHILGYAGLDNRGLAGLELQLDKTIAGKPGSERRVIDALGHVLDVVDQRPAVDGRNLRLTIDHTIQANAEAVLRQTVSKWGAKGATAVVMDPRNGAVLAMANAPGFDANAFGATPPAVTRNRAVTDVYEPGSTFKLVTVAGVLSDRPVTPQTKFTLPYSIHVADRVIRRGGTRHRDDERRADPRAVVNVALRSRWPRSWPDARLYRWMRRFGFGSATRVGFPAESPGFVLKPDEWSGSTIGNVPIGQGVAVTPVQMAAAYSSIANHGVWVQPNLVERVQGGKRFRPQTRRVVRRTVAAQLNAMLQNVVLGGTGTLAAVNGYKVAGKTGTAQKPDAHGGYSGGHYVSSFVGMVPASSASWSTSRAAPSGAASWPRLRSRRSPPTTCSTSRFRRTTATPRASL